MRRAKFILERLKSGKTHSLACYLFLKQVGGVRACLAAAVTRGILQENVCTRMFVRHLHVK